MRPKPLLRLALILGVALSAGACHRAGPASTPQTGVVAHSTVGWGCPAPPFRHAHCDPTTQTEADPRKCMFLTVRPDGTPWDFAQTNQGRYVLDATPADARMTHEAWMQKAGQPRAEGSCSPDAEPQAAPLEYPVFVVRDFCLEQTAEQARTALEIGVSSDWLRAHRCKPPRG